jgi:hypothetical protein
MVAESLVHRVAPGIEGRALRVVFEASDKEFNQRGSLEVPALVRTRVGRRTSIELTLQISPWERRAGRRFGSGSRPVRGLRQSFTIATSFGHIARPVSDLTGDARAYRRASRDGIEPLKSLSRAAYEAGSIPPGRRDDVARSSTIISE